jgi:hypothetical protein
LLQSNSEEMERISFVQQRRSTLRSAARAATAKKAARQTEEDKKIEIEDEEWGASVLDAMADRLGIRKEVQKDIKDNRWNQ